MMALCNEESVGFLKTLRVFEFLLSVGLRGSCGAQAKGRGRRGDFSMVRIRLARFALPRLGLGGSKSGVSCSPLVCRVRGTIENVRASAARPEAASIALRDHRLSETANFEKVGPTYFLNLFRTVISLCRLVMAIGCKLCPREKLPSHFAKSGGKRLR
jgi:hypothetical protein